MSSPGGTTEGTIRTISFAPGGAWEVFETARPTIEMVGYCRGSRRDKNPNTFV